MSTTPNEPPPPEPPRRRNGPWYVSPWGYLPLFVPTGTSQHLWRRP